MAPSRTRTCRLLSWGLLPLCLLVLALLCAQDLARAGASKPSGSSERLRELMTQRYELLKGAMKNSELMLEAGRIDVLTHQNLTADLYRAEADLCPTGAERVKVYEKLVEALTGLERLLERQAGAGRATEVQVAQGRLVTLNTQIELERLRLGQAASRP